VLVLPDERVEGYSVLDADRYHRLIDRSLITLIHQSPFRVYDPLIKATARQFIEKRYGFPDRGGKWTKEAPRDLQRICELVFVTATRTHLIVSRGKDEFSFDRERRYPLRWHT